MSKCGCRGSTMIGFDCFLLSVENRKLHAIPAENRANLLNYHKIKAAEQTTREQTLLRLLNARKRNIRPKQAIETRL